MEFARRLKTYVSNQKQAKWVFFVTSLNLPQKQFSTLRNSIGVPRK
jgi:hypothetical protein